MKARATLLAAATIGSIVVGVSGALAEGSGLSGVQIRTRFAGMQLTDEVHYRFAYDRDGTLRSYAMGVKKVGRWVIQKDELCLYLQEPDDGCYEVSLAGNTVEMKPTGLGGTIDGVLQTPN